MAQAFVALALSSILFLFIRTYRARLLRQKEVQIKNEHAFIPVTDIDRRQCKRVVPMRVLVLGLSRTGTNSIRIALEQLGYHTTYHGYHAALGNPRDCEMWYQALQAKFLGRGKPFGREEFDQLLGHCEAVTDVPAICFPEELIAAYPEAKIILTNRDVDKWHESVMRNIIDRVYNHQAAFISKLASVFNSTGRWSRPVFLLCWEKYFRHFQTNGKTVFHEHYAKVRSLVPKDQILEYKVQEGWGPLCRFLGQKEPTHSFPQSNDARETADLIRQLVVDEALKAAMQLSFISSATLAVWCGFELM